MLTREEVNQRQAAHEKKVAAEMEAKKDAADERAAKAAFLKAGGEEYDWSPQVFKQIQGEAVARRLVEAEENALREMRASGTSRI
jgi:hypothetical protein